MFPLSLGCKQVHKPSTVQGKWGEGECMEACRRYPPPIKRVQISETKSNVWSSPSIFAYITKTGMCRPTGWWFWTGSPELERGIHFRDVSYIMGSLDCSAFRISFRKMERENKEGLNCHELFCYRLFCFCWRKSVKPYTDKLNRKTLNTRLLVLKVKILKIAVFLIFSTEQASWVIASNNKNAFF